MGGSEDTGGKGEVVTMTNAVTVTYTTICPTDAARLMTLEYCTTITTTQPCSNSVTTTPAVPMTTYAETCDACGPNGESIVTLAIPQAVVAGTGGGQVIAITVQTVVPVPFVASTNVSFVTPSVVSSTDVPVTAGTPARKTTAGFVATLGYGVAIWFVIFGIGITL
jgi:hypothetical protein